MEKLVSESGYLTFVVRTLLALSNNQMEGMQLNQQLELLNYKIGLIQFEFDGWSSEKLFIHLLLEPSSFLGKRSTLSAIKWKKRYLNNYAIEEIQFEVHHERS